MRRLFVILLVGMLGFTLTACGDKASHEAQGDELNQVVNHLQAAKTKLDASSAVNITLSAPTADISATGYGTHQPGFQGDVTSSLGTVSVIALGDKVWAKGSVLYPTWTIINPADFQLPNPASLMRPDGGLSSLLTAVTSLKTGIQSRDGHNIVTSYSGKIPGSVMQKFVPSADATAEFGAAFRLTDHDDLVSATLSGPFFKATEQVTFTMAISVCTDCSQVAAPTS